MEKRSFVRLELPSRTRVSNPGVDAQKRSTAVARWSCVCTHSFEHVTRRTFETEGTGRGGKNETFFLVRSEFCVPSWLLRRLSNARVYYNIRQRLPVRASCPHVRLEENFENFCSIKFIKLGKSILLGRL